MIVLVLVSLILHNSMRLHVSQCFHCVKTDNVHQTLLAHLTSFLLKNAFERRKTLHPVLVILVRRNFLRLHVSQCVHCVKTNNVHKTRFFSTK